MCRSLVGETGGAFCSERVEACTGCRSVGCTVEGNVSFEMHELVFKPRWGLPGRLAEVAVYPLGFVNALFKDGGDTTEVIELFLKTSWLLDGRLDLEKGVDVVGMGVGDSKEFGFEVLLSLLECSLEVLLGVLKGGCMALVLEPGAFFPFHIGVRNSTGDE